MGEPGGGSPPELDRLAVLGIEAFGHHGVLPEERRDGQTFVVDLALGLDTRTAAGSDDLRDTVDYGTLVARVKEAIESDPVDLIETLAQRLVEICLEDPRVRRAEVTVHKPGAPIAARFADVTLTVTRSRRIPPTSTGADRD
jgi:dihydroneopterin aldolase